MPPLPRLKVAALAELARQLRFAPPEAARRQLLRAEELAEQVIADEGAAARTYPEDWIIFRITGYRPEIDEPALIVGRALVGDLAALVERLSAAAGITEEELAGEEGAAEQQSGRAADGTAREDESGVGAWMRLEELCERWGVSGKTIERYRRMGLLARRVMAGRPAGAGAAGDAGRRAMQRLVFSRRVVEAFERRHGAMLSRAGRFSRMGAPAEARLVEAARRCRARFGWSLGETAAALARKHKRGHETMRQLLLRAEARADRRVFAPAGALTDEQERRIERAFHWGIDGAAIAARYGRSVASVYRVISQRRAARLRGLELGGAEAGAAPVVPAGAKYAPAKVLAAPWVVQGLGGRGAPNLAVMLEQAKEDSVIDPRAEAARGAAYWVLRRECARRIAALARYSPAAGALDEIETRLRWASRLKAELVRSQQPLVFKTIQARLGRPVTALARAEAERLVAACMEAVIEAAEKFDPFKGGRLASPAGLAVNRVVGQWAGREERAARHESGKAASKGGEAGGKMEAVRAVARVEAGEVVLEDWARRVNSWQAWLEPDERVRGAVESAGGGGDGVGGRASEGGVAEGASEAARRLLIARYGWAGAPPRTLAEVAQEMGTTPKHAAALERRTIVRLTRGGVGGGGARAGGVTSEEGGERG